jgi:uncharacterized cupredoxin-like copper-binding protein
VAGRAWGSYVKRRGGRLGLAVVLLVGLAACRPASASGGIRTVVITIHYSHFEPSSFTFPPGTTVRVVVHNTDPIDHEFILGDQRVQQIHERGTERHHPPRPGEMSVPAGTIRVTVYTFGGPGQLIFGCHLPGHYAYGMRGTVTVA